MSDNSTANVENAYAKRRAAKAAQAAAQAAAAAAPRPSIAAAVWARILAISTGFSLTPWFAWAWASRGTGRTSRKRANRSYFARPTRGAAGDYDNDSDGEVEDVLNGHGGPNAESEEDRAQREYDEARAQQPWAFGVGQEFGTHPFFVSGDLSQVPMLVLAQQVLRGMREMVSRTISNVFFVLYNYVLLELASLSLNVLVLLFSTIVILPLCAVAGFIYDFCIEPILYRLASLATDLGERSYSLSEVMSGLSELPHLVYLVSLTYLFAYPKWHLWREHKPLHVRPVCYYGFPWVIERFVRGAPAPWPDNFIEFTEEQLWNWQEEQPTYPPIIFQWLWALGLIYLYRQCLFVYQEAVFLPISLLDSITFFARTMFESVVFVGLGLRNYVYQVVALCTRTIVYWLLVLAHHAHEVYLSYSYILDPDFYPEPICGTMHIVRCIGEIIGDITLNIYRVIRWILRRQWVAVRIVIVSLLVGSYLVTYHPVLSSTVFAIVLFAGVSHEFIANLPEDPNPPEESIAHGIPSGARWYNDLKSRYGGDYFVRKQLAELDVNWAEIQLLEREIEEKKALLKHIVDDDLRMQAMEQSRLAKQLRERQKQIMDFAWGWEHLRKEGVTYPTLKYFPCWIARKGHNLPAVAVYPRTFYEPAYPNATQARYIREYKKKHGGRVCCSCSTHGVDRGCNCYCHICTGFYE